MIMMLVVYQVKTVREQAAAKGEVDIVAQPGIRYLTPRFRVPRQAVSARHALRMAVQQDQRPDVETGVHGPLPHLFGLA
jgi:hypothetical protein